MFRNSVAPTINRAFLDAIATAYGTRPAAALAPTLTVKLINSAVLVLTPDTDLATLTAAEANFSGYSAQSLTITGPVRGGTKYEGMIGTVTFVATTASPFVTDTAYGYWVETAGALLMAEMFGAGSQVPFGNVGDFLDLDALLPALSF
jgi:hypothetical protein